MLRICAYLLFLLPLLACEEAAEADNDHNLIDEEKVQIKYQQLKENLIEAGEQMDSLGKEVKKDVDNFGKKIDRKI